MGLDITSLYDMASRKSRGQYGDEKVSGSPYSTFQYLKRTYMKAGERFLQGYVVIEQEGMASN